MGWSGWGLGMIGRRASKVVEEEDGWGKGSRNQLYQRPQYGGSPFGFPFTAPNKRGGVGGEGCGGW